MVVSSMSVSVTGASRPRPTVQRWIAGSPAPDPPGDDDERRPQAHPSLLRPVVVSLCRSPNRPIRLADPSVEARPSSPVDVEVQPVEDLRRANSNVYGGVNALAARSPAGQTRKVQDSTTRDDERSAAVAGADVASPRIDADVARQDPIEAREEFRHASKLMSDDEVLRRKLG